MEIKGFWAGNNPNHPAQHNETHRAGKSCMILPFMTQAERRIARLKNIGDHIRLLEERHSESARREAVKLLKKRLSQIPSEKNDFQTKPQIQTGI